VARIEIRGGQLLAALVIRAEDPEAVEGIADERVSLVNMGRALAKRVTVIPATGLRSTGAGVLDLVGELIPAG
jgi:hypothetical protein